MITKTQNTKTSLLTCLKENRGTWISGETLSRKLDVSRAAVWKHIKTLRESGYFIESSRKKGYLFTGVLDLLLEEEILDGLDTKVFGKKKLICLQETESTNFIAKNLAAAGAPEGTLVTAESQTSGRGRKGRTWVSPSGKGIYASMILRPHIPPDEAPKITLLTAVAAAETLICLVKTDAKIKWPNDILIGTKKIAGILTEISLEMDAVDYIVVGIGLNVNTQPQDIPDDLKEKATSVLIETGRKFSRVKILQKFLSLYEKYYDVFKNKGFRPVLARWKELSNIVGKKICVDMINKELSGTVEDVDDDGVLILKDSSGKIHRIFSGDITLN